MSSQKLFRMTVVMLVSYPTWSVGQVLTEQQSDESVAIASGPKNASNPQQLSHREKVQQLMKNLQDGIRRLEQQSGYSADALIQERIPDCWADDLPAEDVRNGEVGPEEIVKIKVRHKPFSIYMNWSTVYKGRELLFVAGKNENKFVLHSSRLPISLRLSPDSERVKRERRYPITKFGLLFLATRLYTNLDADMRRDLGRSTCDIASGQVFEGRPTELFTLVHDRPELNQLYRKAVVHLDKEWLLPVSLTAYTWPANNSNGDIDKETFIERYEYKNINFQNSPTAADFEEANPNYRFKR